MNPGLFPVVNGYNKINTQGKKMILTNCQDHSYKSFTR